ncbi:S41 family peptidase [Runella zeae]|uniref:S41 family peptidase n=1 Tax=Runella zeae TaxID=94255 RepID=UPI000423DD65|nr:S41 family peptidase [Runella zeae]
MKKQLLSFLLVSIFARSIAQVYSVEQSKSDLNFLRHILEEAHPGLYWYTPKDSMDSAFEKAFNQLDRPMSEKELFFKWAPLITNIHCGHTYLMNSEAFDAQKDDNSWFPFHCQVINNQLFVRLLGKNCSDTTLVRGTEILRINDRPVSEFIQTARNYCQADGYNQTFKDYFLSLYRLEETINDLYNIKAPYRMLVKSPRGEVRESIVFTKTRTVVSNTSSKPSKAEKKQQAKAALEKLRNFKVLSEAPHTLLMTCNGFGYEDHKKFHKSVFRVLEQQKIKNLIIDLRNNPGGDTGSSDDILRYVLTQAIPNFRTCDAPVNQLSFTAHIAPAPKDHLFNPKELKQLPNGQYRRIADGIEIVKPYKKGHFNGQIYVLTSGFTFSAGAILASLLKAHTNAILIGQETGGGEAGCSGGLTSKVILPQTKMIVNFPHFRLETNTSAPNVGRGVQPHYPVVYTAKDIASGRDVEMEKAIKLILNRKETF